jgi:hypothetical protein
MRRHGAAVIELREETADLEDVFLELVRERGQA